MYNEWSLNALYKGIEDPQLAADMARLAEITEAYKQAVYELNAADAAGAATMETTARAIAPKKSFTAFIFVKLRLFSIIEL